MANFFVRDSGRYGISLVLIGLVVGLIALLTFGYLETTAGMQQAVSSYETRRGVLVLLTDLLDEETGMRGFTITNNRSFLVPYASARARFWVHLNEARQSSDVADAPGVESKLHDLALLYQQWLDQVAQPLIARPKRNDAIQLQHRGKDLMDHMRLDVTQALVALDARTTTYVDRTKTQLAIGAVLAGLIVLAFCWTILAMFRSQQRIAGERDRIIETAHDLIGVARMDGFFVSVNRAAERILGRPRAELLAKPFVYFVHPDDVERTLDAMSGLVSGQIVEGFRNRYLASDGTYRWLVWNSVPDVQRGLIYASARDETERVESEIEREHLAFNDVLTGLPNRASFFAHTARALTLAKRVRMDVVVLLLDLDGFKSVNDSYGHAAGDELLRGIARNIRSAVRGADLVARLGGDEFTILLQAESDTIDTEVVVRKVQHAVSLPHRIEGREVRVRASVGVARYPQDGDTVEALLAMADRAMYRAKGGMAPVVRSS